jgi:hypothetical protein
MIFPLSNTVLALPARRPGFGGGNLRAVHGKTTAPGLEFDRVHRSPKFLNYAANIKSLNSAELARESLAQTG